MQKNKPVLTIAIPTYNRVKELDILLKKILLQNSHAIQILISDDNSADDTEKMIMRYQKKYSNIRFNKNSPNFGFSHNICKLYELSQTKYIWFLCDDDIIVPGAIKRIMRVIERYEPTVAIFNYSWIDPFGRKVTAAPIKESLHTNLNLLTDYQPLMRLTFLSNLVMRKGPSLAELKKTNYKQNIFFQVTLGLFLLNKRFRLVESPEMILHRNVGYKYGEFFKSYMTDHLDAILAIKTKFKKSGFITWSNNQIGTALALYLAQKLGMFTFNGEPSKATDKKLRAYYPHNFVFLKLFPYIKMFTPAFVLRMVYFVRLLQINGYKEARLIYTKNINRAYTDTRASGFLQNK